MSAGGRPRRGRRGPKPETTDEPVPEDTPTSLAGDSVALAVFKEATKFLNERQDRHERLVKMSRDVTIESKRIIFLLHSPVKKEGYEKCIEDAKNRLDKLVEGPLKTIGLELEESPAYLHHRAVTAGLQEYIEARTLYSITSLGTIISYEDAQKELEYSVTEKEETRTVVTLLPHTDYMLGIADLTGELMRKAIHSIGEGNVDDVYKACQVVRDLYTGFLGLSQCRLLSRKLPTTRSNVHKTEMAVYGLKLRDDFGRPPAAAIADAQIVHLGMPEDADADDGFY
ncbi:unnamed protein product [Chrysodeixis includens]|uniref:Translin-associated protein X n=1 Tax=Chrysodeixis includens TaxID=689277 RepID=A0A9P0BNF0_CHRIL|nr:unnamed protein product [Chrysodeixis includens]